LNCFRLELWNNESISFLDAPVNNARTVSDTKRAFYSLHTRPINSIYRRVVEELIVEMHLLSVNADFHYDRIYALGVDTAFRRFMQGYRPDKDLPSIFNALCRAMEYDPQTLQADADQIRAEASQLSTDAFLKLINPLDSNNGQDLFVQLRQVADNANFKYSRLFAIGLFSLLEAIDPDLIKDEKRRTESLQKLCEALHLSEEKVQRDLDLYRSNLEKMTQAQVVMEDILKAERRKKEERVKSKDAIASPPTPSQDS
jgi:photosystem II biogenesis protein Psp29